MAIKEAFGDRSAVFLESYEIKDWLISLGLAAATLNRYKSTLSAVYTYAKERKLVESNPCRDVSQTTPEASRPCLFSNLLTLDCDSVLCTTWRVKSASAARSEIDAQEKFISFFKVGVFDPGHDRRDTASLETGAGAKAANSNVDDLSGVIRTLDKKAQGEFSLRLLLAARSPEQLRGMVPTVHRVFVDAHAQVIEETLGNLSAFYAMFPGNHKFNVFPMWLAEDHHARLSSVFTPHIGHPHSEDLDNEY